MRKVEANKADIIKYEEYMLKDADVAIFAYGVSGRSAKTAVEAARAEGIKAGLFRPLTIWPFPRSRSRNSRSASRGSSSRAIPGPDHLRGGPVLEGPVQGGGDLPGRRRPHQPGADPGQGKGGQVAWRSTTISISAAGNFPISGARGAPTASSSSRSCASSTP